MGWSATETGEKRSYNEETLNGIFIIIMHICIKTYQIKHSKNVWFIVSIISQQSCKKLNKKEGSLIMSMSCNVHRGSTKMYMLGSASGSEN